MRVLRVVILITDLDQRIALLVVMVVDLSATAGLWTRAILPAVTGHTLLQRAVPAANLAVPAIAAPLAIAALAALVVILLQAAIALTEEELVARLHAATEDATPPHQRRRGSSATASISRTKRVLRATDTTGQYLSVTKRWLTHQEDQSTVASLSQSYITPNLGISTTMSRMRNITTAETTRANTTVDNHNNQHTRYAEAITPKNLQDALTQRLKGRTDMLQRDRAAGAEIPSVEITEERVAPSVAEGLLEATIEAMQDLVRHQSQNSIEAATTMNKIDTQETPEAQPNSTVENTVEMETWNTVESTEDNTMPQHARPPLTRHSEFKRDNQSESQPADAIEVHQEDNQSESQPADAIKVQPADAIKVHQEDNIEN